jgi:hypothetical protein
MIWFLRATFLGILLCMLTVTTWASRLQAIWAIPTEVLSNPWFIATLFDAYFGFLTFYVWVAYRERRWISRLLWLIAILLLGNIAMATYVLLQLFALPASAPLSSLWLRRDPAAAR